MGLAYIFETRGIQRYIFETGKLRDVSGASELIGSLCYEPEEDNGRYAIEGMAKKIIEFSGLTAKVERCAGGVLELSAELGQSDALIRFRALWRLAVARQTPSLNFADGISSNGQVPGETDQPRSHLARHDMYSAGPLSMPLIPPASPLMRPAPHSGRAPGIRTGWTKAKGGHCAITGEWADLPTLAKRQWLKNGADDMGSNILPCQFAGARADKYKWPVVFDTADLVEDEKVPVFPFPNPECKTVALIHVDGNGVGQLFQAASARLNSTQKRAFSSGLNRTIRRTVQNTVGSVVLSEADKTTKTVPIRPILLGGDDISLIIRADLAFAFLNALLPAIETGTAKLFKDFNLGLPSGLTSKAGIVFLGPKQPFSQAYELCEALASEAKDTKVSKISFWRLTNSYIPIRAGDLQQQRGLKGENGTLWRKSWTLAELDDLQCLSNLLQHDDVGGGAMRRVSDVLLRDKVEAERLYSQGLKALARRNKTIHAALLECLKRFDLNEDTLVPASGYCPLLDAHDLIQIGKGGGE